MKLFFRIPFVPLGDGGFILGILYTPPTSSHLGVNIPHMLTFGFGLFDITVVWGG